jgi:hypothetical protein
MGSTRDVSAGYTQAAQQFEKALDPCLRRDDNGSCYLNYIDQIVRSPDYAGQPVRSHHKPMADATLRNELAVDENQPSSLATGFGAGVASVDGDAGMLLVTVGSAG